MDNACVCNLNNKYEVIQWIFFHLILTTKKFVKVLYENYILLRGKLDFAT